MPEGNCEFARCLEMDLPVGQSTFLWGARKTGKSHYLRRKFSDAVYYDLLKTDVYFRLLKNPHLLRQEILALSQEKLCQPIIVDEIQKIPALLDEVHWLIENTDAYFILCGSSARKLRSQGVNLLGGRAWSQSFYPLIAAEIPGFDLLNALNKGLIPSHYQAAHWQKTIIAYINDYLKEEIKAEGLARNLRDFAQFLDVSAFSNGEIVNAANIARECGISAKQVREYYQILMDTLVGYQLLPYQDRKKREDLIATPKFYFFDTGVVSGITQQSIGKLQGSLAERAFEHFIFMELIAHRGLNSMTHDISFYRTRSGHEVDFILGKAATAVEVKISPHVHLADIQGLAHFMKTHPKSKGLVVCTTPQAYKVTTKEGQSIQVMPWQLFLEQLWNRGISL